MSVIRTLAILLLAALWLPLASVSVAQDDAQPDASQPGQPERNEPPPLPSVDECLAAFGQSEPATWRTAAEQLVKGHGEAAIPGLIERLGSPNERLAIRAGSALRRMGLLAVAALRAAGQADLATDILRDRVQVMLIGPEVTPELPAETPATVDASTVSFELSRGGSSARYDLLEIVRFQPVDADSVRVLAVRYLSLPTTVDPEAGADALPPDEAKVFFRAGTLPTRHLSTLAAACELIQATELHGAGPRKGDRGPIGPGFGPAEIDDTLAPSRYAGTRVLVGGAARATFGWVGDPEMTQPDFIRSMAALRALSAFPLTLEEVTASDLTAADRAWVTSRVAEMRTRATQPLHAWIFARALRVLAVAGEPAAATSTLRAVLTDAATPPTTKLLAIHTVVAWKQPQTDPRPDPFPLDQLDAVRDQVLPLLDE